MLSPKIPNFIVFGAMRCGSTTLYNLLSQHPDIFMAPVRKELNFFFHLLRDEASIVDYSSYFAGWNGQKAIGEGSVSYIYHRPIAEAIKMYLPDVKLVCILRNPARRAYSNYCLTLNWGKEWLDFEDAIRQENERIGDIADSPYMAYYSYVSRGFYAQQLRHYLKFFHRQNVYCVLLEDLVRNPQSELEGLCDFLGVDKNHKFKMIDKGDNGSNANQFPLYPKLMHRLAYFRYKVFRDKHLFWRFDNTLGKFQETIPRTNKVPSMSKEVYQRLMSLFEKDILDLANLDIPSALQWLN